QGSFKLDRAGRAACESDVSISISPFSAKGRLWQITGPNSRTRRSCSRSIPTPSRAMRRLSAAWPACRAGIRRRATVRISRRLRDAVAVFAMALVASALTLAPPLDRFRGLGIDILTWLRWRAGIATHHARESPTVVVALDEETYRRAPFAGTPAITWTPEIAQVLTAIIAGGAKVVGFDIVFPTSIEQSEIPFGDGTLGGRLRGFDRDFLRALALGARDGKVVLGDTQHRDFPIMPSPGQRI